MKLSELIQNKIAVHGDDVDAAANAITARLHECVKPLEWEVVDAKWFTCCAKGYSVTTRATAPHVNATGPMGEDLGVYDHSDDAKAAAQEHYAAQIIAGLDQ